MTWRRSNGGAWHACMTSGWPPRSEQLDNSGHRQAACNLLVKLDQCNTGKELVAHELWVHRLAKGTARALPFWPRSSGALLLYLPAASKPAAWWKCSILFPQQHKALDTHCDT